MFVNQQLLQNKYCQLSIKCHNIFMLNELFIKVHVYLPSCICPCIKNVIYIYINIFYLSFKKSVCEYLIYQLHACLQHYNFHLYSIPTSFCFYRNNCPHIFLHLQIQLYTWISTTSIIFTQPVLCPRNVNYVYFFVSWVGLELYQKYLLINLYLLKHIHVVSYS